MNSDIKPEEILRYSRHLVIPEIGLQGQIKLKNSSVLIIGCGGLGSPITQYLAASGIGRIGIVDYDVVELSNLQRQPLYTTKDIGKSKVELAQARLQKINPEIKVDIYGDMFTSKNAEKIAEPYSILIDGTDNIPTRYLINDLCVFTNKPYIYGAVYRFFGQAGIFYASKGGCYRCMMPKPPSPEVVPSCAIAGVVSVMPGIIGLFQANETIKFILGIGSPLISKLLLFDALQITSNVIQVTKNPECTVCGTHPTLKHLIDYEEFCNMPIRDEDIESENGTKISSSELKEKIDQNQQFKLIDLRNPVELQIIQLEGVENIPFHHLTDSMKKWDKDQEIILICHIGFLSSIAQRIMSEAGFSQVRSLKGGIRAWAQASDSTDIIY